MTEPRGLVWIFPNHPINKEMHKAFTEHKNDEDIFIGFCSSLILIDLDKCVMYIANEDNPKLLRVKEIEV